ncbi:hypothetical protein WJX81_006253 [Elliptochloris bilobata]|uniref:INO80 complex subunit B-like conserved region domain-containing protein n=1 Tax=Elliptochloris bilobata TaxID=381761 RepID=A0AAW1SIC6_9CHLO
MGKLQQPSILAQESDDEVPANTGTRKRKRAGEQAATGGPNGVRRAGEDAQWRRVLARAGPAPDSDDGGLPGDSDDDMLGAPSDDEAAREESEGATRIEAEVQAKKAAAAVERKEARRAAEAHRAHVAAAQAQRRTQAALLRKRTCRGQPVMRFRVDKVLAQLQAEAEA